MVHHCTGPCIPLINVHGSYLSVPLSASLLGALCELSLLSYIRAILVKNPIMAGKTMDFATFWDPPPVTFVLGMLPQF